MLLVKTYLDKSPISGIGLFAAEPFLVPHGYFHSEAGHDFSSACISDLRD